MAKSKERRSDRVSMVRQQLEEIDRARDKVKAYLDDMVNQKDTTYMVDALVKLHKAERDLYDEAFLQSDLEGEEFDVADLVE